MQKVVKFIKMEAASIQKKKNSINKGKLKKTIKNVLCRPDPVFWPLVSVEQEKVLKTALSKHKVHIPEFKKPHWKELKLLPKEKRPKPPKIGKVDGFLFGISTCTNAVQSGQCSAIIIESTVNPQAIVQPLLEACIKAEVPVVCLSGLRKISANNFGIPTSCLGMKKNCLQDISSKIILFAKEKVPESPKVIAESKLDVEMSINTPTEVIVMDTREIPQDVYLYRKNKKERVFVPPSEEKVAKTTKEFIGQNFIEFSEKTDTQTNKKAYKKMKVKRISNNPNRVKLKVK